MHSGQKPACHGDGPSHRDAAGRQVGQGPEHSPGKGGQEEGQAAEAGAQPAARSPEQNRGPGGEVWRRGLEERPGGKAWRPHDRTCT